MVALTSCSFDNSDLIVLWLLAIIGHQSLKVFSIFLFRVEDCEQHYKAQLQQLQQQLQQTHQQLADVKQRDHTVIQTQLQKILALEARSPFFFLEISFFYISINHVIWNSL